MVNNGKSILYQQVRSSITAIISSFPEVPSCSILGSTRWAHFQLSVKGSRPASGCLMLSEGRSAPPASFPVCHKSLSLKSEEVLTMKLNVATSKKETEILFTGQHFNLPRMWRDEMNSQKFHILRKLPSLFPSAELTPDFSTSIVSLFCNRFIFVLDDNTELN